MQGKRGLIMGLANDRSLAWGIARAVAGQGAELAFSYQGEALEKRVRPLAAELGSDVLVDCDVSDMKALDKTFDALKEQWGKLDFVVHAAAFAPKADLDNPVWQASRDGFRVALDVSAYSLIALTRASVPLMKKAGGGSILTLTYLGSERVFTNYNLMGVAKAALETEVRYLASELGPDNIRVNAISAGPIKTLAAKGISGFSQILHVYPERAPLRRNIEAAEVAESAAFLLGDAGKGITGEVMMVDAGYHIAGM